MLRGTFEVRGGVRSVVLYRRVSLQLECLIYTCNIWGRVGSLARRGFPGWENPTQLFVFVWTQSWLLPFLYCC